MYLYTVWELKRTWIFSCQNDSTMHQQWFVSLIRQSEVTLFQPITSISPFCGCISESYCILINSSKSTALFWSKQSPYKISLSVSTDDFMSVNWKTNGAEIFHSKLLVNFKETACVKHYNFEVEKLEWIKTYSSNLSKIYLQLKCINIYTHHHRNI